MSVRITASQDINVSDDFHRTILVRYSETQYDNTIAARIANNTAQTWQQNRGRQETFDNTKQGKIAEELFRLYLSQKYPELKVLPYDEIRNDDYQKHAPFDYLVWEGDCNLDLIVEAIRYDITNSDRYVNLSQNTRTLCQRENVKIIEVKSTKIADRHKRSCLFNRGDYNNLSKVAALSRVILNDDFLTYPHLCRSTPMSNFSVNDYIRWLQSKGINVNSEEGMRRFEMLNQTADVFVRVYVDEMEQAGLLMGWIDKESFYRNAVIKKMPKPGKSEAALYFATSLRNGNNLDNFPALFNT